MTAAEEDASSVIGAEILQFGYDEGCIVLALSDGREVRFGSDRGRVWFIVQEYTVH